MSTVTYKLCCNLKSPKLNFIEANENKLPERKRDSEIFRIPSFVLGGGGGESNSP